MIVDCICLVFNMLWISEKALHGNSESTCLIKTINEATIPSQKVFWRWISHSQGGRCEFPGRYLDIFRFLEGFPRINVLPCWISGAHPFQLHSSYPNGHQIYLMLYTGLKFPKFPNQQSHGMASMHLISSYIFLSHKWYIILNVSIQVIYVSTSCFSLFSETSLFLRSENPGEVCLYKNTGQPFCSMALGASQLLDLLPLVSLLWE